MYTRIKTAVIHYGGGALNKEGELDERTRLKLSELQNAAAAFQESRIPYVYVFSAGRNPGEQGQRPCDLLRLWAVEVDPYLRSVIVPDSGIDLVTDTEKGNFFRERTRDWRGATISIN